MRSVFSVDVEDWFHILDLNSAPALSEWDSLPSRVDKNFRKLLDIFGEHGVHTTCFFLGWIARKHPHLVREAERNGHEIASHGYAHRLVYEMTPEEFYKDSLKSRKILEDIAGRGVLGYRSAGFSVTTSTDWMFSKLMEAGYIYDSSVFPASRGHGGLESGLRVPYRIRRSAGELVEFPMTVTEVLGRPLCFFGGGYLRFFPYPIVRKMTRRVLNEGRPVVFYVHPREIDPLHPRLPMSWKRRFKSYVNLSTTETKLHQIFSEFECTSFERVLAEQQAEIPSEESLLSRGNSGEVFSAVRQVSE